MPLCFHVIEKLAALAGAYEAFQHAYPIIVSLWEPVRGLLMPESFWDFGFEPKDRERMLREIEAAREKLERLESNYLSYQIADKLAVEKVYREMLMELGSVESGT